MTFQELVAAYKRKQETGQTHSPALYADGLVDQGVFLLEKAIEVMPCPHCRERCSQLEAAQAAKNAWWGNLEVRYECSNCASELEYHVGLYGEPHWTRVPDGTEGTP